MTGLSKTAISATIVSVLTAILGLVGPSVVDVVFKWAAAHPSWGGLITAILGLFLTHSNPKAASA